MNGDLLEEVREKLDELNGRLQPGERIVVHLTEVCGCRISDTAKQDCHLCHNGWSFSATTLRG